MERDLDPSSTMPKDVASKIGLFDITRLLIQLTAGYYDCH
jgi:hypothetical protein